MDKFDIYFLGETLPTADPALVREGVGRLFKLEGPAVERLFSGKPLRVKKEVDVDAASRYRAAFREIGALIQIVPAGAPAPALSATPQRAAAPPPAAAVPPPAAVAPPPPTAPPPEPADEQAALAQTLTLTIVEETFAEEEAPALAAAGRTAAMTLAEPGVTIDETPPAPAAVIDTSGLEALPPNTGSLADCRADKPPRPIPDISHLRLVDD